MKDQNHALVRAAHFQPAFVTVRRILHELKVHLRCPELLCPVLVFDVDHDPGHTADHRIYPPRYWGEIISILGIFRSVLSCQPVKSPRATPEITPAAFQVLLALAAGEAHGYAVMRFVEQLTGGEVRLPPGTLYRTMARLVADGLVEETSRSDPQAPHDARRRYYQLTRLGRRTTRDEAALLSRLVRAAASLGLLPRED